MDIGELSERHRVSVVLTGNHLSRHRQSMTVTMTRGSPRKDPLVSSLSHCRNLFRSNPSYIFCLSISGNYSVSGFELKLTRKMAFYIITYYFPTGMFVIVSWISFLVPPESVPGRMTILVTVFLCLVNIFNSITNKIPKADGLTAIEAFIIICIIFVFGALMGMNRISISISHQAKVECTHQHFTATSCFQNTPQFCFD